MRVGISAEFLGTHLCGIATYTRNLLHGLAEIQTPHSYVPYPAHQRGLKLLPTAEHITPRVVRPYSAWVRLPLSLPAELVRRPVDLLHATAGWGPLWSPCPLVVSIHDLSFLHFPELYPPAMRLRLSLLVRASARRAVRVMAISKFSADDLRARYGLPAEKVRLVYPALDPSIVRVGERAELERVRERYRLNRPFVLCISSLEPRKRVDLVIRGFAALLRRHEPPHELIVVGRQLWGAAPLLRLPSELGIGARVRFLEQVPQADLPALYSLADAFTFMSGFEGFGFPVLEALACGTPVVATASTAVPEAVGQGGLLVESNEPEAVAGALWRVLSDAALRDRLRERGLEHAAQFTPRAFASACVAVYEECLAISQERCRSGRQVRTAVDQASPGREESAA